MSPLAAQLELERRSMRAAIRKIEREFAILVADLCDGGEPEPGAIARELGHLRELRAPLIRKLVELECTRIERDYRVIDRPTGPVDLIVARSLER